MSLDPKSTHYDAGGIETLTIIKAKLTPEQYKGYLLGNIIKYSTRQNYKGDPRRDAEKCAFYADAQVMFMAEISHIEGYIPKNI
jgi:hypothetical protein